MHGYGRAKDSMKIGASMHSSLLVRNQVQSNRFYVYITVVTRSDQQSSILHVSSCFHLQLGT